MSMNEQLKQQLIAAAIAVREQAYAPYSQFPVGAALLGKGGTVYTGVNVENASYGLTNCAERVALASAVTAGERTFEALVVASPGGASPCGACRQVLLEFSQKLPVWVIDTTDQNEVTELDLETLLPEPFGPSREA